MSEQLTDIHKAFAMLQSGVDPDRYLFAVAPGYTEVVEQALVKMGVSESLLSVYKIYEAEGISMGDILVIDLHEINKGLTW